MSKFEANIYRLNNQEEVWFKIIIEALDDGYSVYQKLNTITELLCATYGQVKWLEKVN